MRFSEIYRKNKRVISFEFFPPKKQELLADTLKMIKELALYQPDFMTVTYGAGGGTRELTAEIVKYIKQTLELLVVQHLTCISHDATEINQIVKSLLSIDVENILALRGDLPLGDSGLENANPNRAFSCARDLTAHLTKNYPALSLAVAGYPETHRDAVSAEADLRYLKEKVDAGAEVVFTQLFFDPELYFVFLEKARKIGITVPIVPGVMPISSVSQIKRFTELCGASIPKTIYDTLERLSEDPAGIVEYGIEYATLQSSKLLKDGAPGLHLYTLNKSIQTGRILENLGITKKQ